MKIGIVGSGNLGTALAADLGRCHEVTMYSSRPEAFGSSLTWYDIDTGTSWSALISGVSDSYADAVSGCEVVFVSVPTFLTRHSVEQIAPYLSNDALLGFVPGAGGVEFLARAAVDKGVTVFGFERVPYVARLTKYGSAVAASKKKQFRVAAIPRGEAGRVSTKMEELFGRPCEPMKEFVSMTLTPSLHTSRLYDLYRDVRAGEAMEENPYFYREWTDSASELTFMMDTELHRVCAALTENGISAREVVPYSVHYESPTPKLLTKKLRSIQSLADIKGPVIRQSDGSYILDIDSRYFTESYPYRLCIVRGFAELLGIDTPVTDRVIRWYESLAGKEYIVDGSLCGSDIGECSIPQNYGVQTIEELKDYY